MGFYQLGFRVVIVIGVVVSVVSGYKYFQERIPNGNKVPHPCIPNTVWYGVGHESMSGGGPRNQFGKDFLANGKVWSRALCELDSDGDGITNGHELGDPECTWTPGSTPASPTAHSHPGVCEPLGPQCLGRNGFLKCEEFHCDAINDNQTLLFTVQIPPTPVPAQETTYVCMPFKFPSDSPYHMVAYKPNITNWNVMHHAIMYGCVDNAQIYESDFGQPHYDCYMGDIKGCVEFLAVWALGIDGYCFHPKSGLKVGQGGYTRGVLELHWNNPEEVSTYMDGSGIDIYLTSVLRPNDAGVLMFGEKRLYIPPGEESFTVEGACHSHCTEDYMQGDIQVFSAFNHMHTLGRKIISKIRQNYSEIFLGRDEVYDFNAPKMHDIMPPLTMKAGDQLELSCTFDSTSRNVTTKWGLGTSDEMCYTFLFYYPAQNLRVQKCQSQGIYKACEAKTSNVNGCDFGNALNDSIPAVEERLTIVFRLCSHIMCLKECKEYVKALYKDPCYNEENRPFLKELFLSLEINREAILDYWSRIESCDKNITMEAAMKSLELPPSYYQGNANEAANVKVIGQMVSSVLLVAWLFK